jgi:hypothetical protein
MFLKKLHSVHYIEYFVAMGKLYGSLFRVKMPIKKFTMGNEFLLQ